MDGIGVPIVGALAGVVLFLVCATTPDLRRFALAALVSPFTSSVVFIACEVLADETRGLGLIGKSVGVAPKSGAT